MLFANLQAAGFEVRSWNNAELFLTHAIPACEQEVENALLGLSIKMSDLIKGGGGLSSVTGQLRKRFKKLGWPKQRLLVITRAYDVTNRKAGGRLPPHFRQINKPIHEIDHTKTFADQLTAGEKHLAGLEIEWNSKDSVFYRDLSNIGFLHTEQLLSIAIIITRGQSLQKQLPTFVRRFANRYRVGSVADIRSKKLYRISDAAADAINSMVAAGQRFEDAWARQFTQSKYGSTTTHARKLIRQINRGAGGLLPIALIGIPDSAVTI